MSCLAKGDNLRRRFLLRFIWVKCEMLAMLGRLKELMTGGSKPASTRSYLGGYLDKVCSRYVARYEELSSQDDMVDALNVLASLVMNEIMGCEVDEAAARAYLSILIDNDHLPPTHQLNESELTCLRELLLGYFSNSESVNDKGSQVLSLIDKKFTAGEFSQARILLQIFDTTEETRQNNERNLYYEEMILRLDMVISKSRGCPASLVEEVCHPEASDEIVIKAFNHLSRECGVNFYLHTVDLKERERWQNEIDRLPEPVKDYLYDYIPVMQWRTFGMLNEPIESQISRHMTFEMLRRHVQARLRMCYFLLLASGNTGYEWYIFSFTRWSQKHFGVDVRDVFPMLHRCGVVDNMCLQEVLDIVTDRFYGPAMNRIVMTTDDLSRAYRAVIRRIFERDTTLIPAGDFNFGDFILDEILPFEYDDSYFIYRLFDMF